MEEKQFNVEFIQALKKKTPVTTEDYEVTETGINTEDTNWINAFCANNFTPLEMIWELKRTKEMIRILSKGWRKLQKTARTQERFTHLIEDADKWIEACEGWEEEYVESKQID